MLQPSCCAPPSVFQTIMGKELQLRQQNFSGFSSRHVFLRENMRHEDAKDILGAICTVLEDKTKVWYVKMPEFIELDGDRPSIQTPFLHVLDDDETNLSDYLEDPTDPKLCVPEQGHDHYWRLLNNSLALESHLGGPGSTMNFWDTSAGTERLPLGVKMHSAAAFLSMPNSDGAVRGGTSTRGFNDQTTRGYPLRLTLTTRQVTDVVIWKAILTLRSLTLLCNQKYAQDGLLKGASDCKLAREPIPVWNIVKIVRTNSDADRVRKTIAFQCSDGSVSINLPSAPMPVPEGEKARLMHPALVTRLTGDKPYYMTGGLIPHLTKKGHFWKSSPPAIHMAILKYRLYIDPVQSANLETVEQIDCGWTAQLPRRSQYDSATGLHQSLSDYAKQHRWLFLRYWGVALFSVSLNVSSICLYEMLAALWVLAHYWIILLENPLRSSSTMIQSVGSPILLKCFLPLS